MLRPFFCMMPLIGLLAGVSSLKAAVLFSQGSPSGDPPRYNSDGPSSGAFPNNPSEVAENFALTGSGIPATLQWFGARSDSPLGSPETFLLRLYSNNASGFGPNSVFYEESTAVIGTDAGTAGLSYTASFVPGTLAAGKTYWLSILDNDPSTSPSGWRWGMFVSPGLDVSFRNGESGIWISTLGDEAVDFTILGLPSPEPSSLTLVVIGGLALGGLTVSRRTRRRVSTR
jgi:hypothetical protein